MQFAIYLNRYFLLFPTYDIIMLLITHSLTHTHTHTRARARAYTHTHITRARTHTLCKFSIIYLQSLI